jgi:hypothetical protein
MKMFHKALIQLTQHSIFNVFAQCGALMFNKMFL